MVRRIDSEHCVFLPWRAINRLQNQKAWLTILVPSSFLAFCLTVPLHILITTNRSIPSHVSFQFTRQSVPIQVETFYLIDEFPHFCPYP
ncbi:hypothetical protein BDV19DRAFT_355519 [Aspergillus venezuelensis]